MNSISYTYLSLNHFTSRNLQSFNVKRCNNLRLSLNHTLFLFSQKAFYPFSYLIEEFIDDLKGMGLYFLRFSKFLYSSWHSYMKAKYHSLSVLCKKYI